jgi:hypothetical protein
MSNDNDIIAFTEYNPVTGEIIKTGKCAKHIVDAMAAAVLDNISDSQYYINITTKLPVAIPPSPGDAFAFNFTTKAWELNTERAWGLIRQQRNYKLTDTDWKMLEDAPGDNTQKNRLKVYRQALRDITNQSDPLNIVWPEL